MFSANRLLPGGRTTFNFLKVCLALLILALAWPYVPVHPAAAQEIVLLYEENFDDGSAQGWDLEASDAGNWWVEGGLLSGAGHVWAEYRQVEWGKGQYSLEFDLVQLDLRNGLHVNLQHSDQGRYLVGFRRINADLLYIYIERNLWNAPSEPLATNEKDPAIYLGDGKYHIQITFGDGQVNVYLIKQGQEEFAHLPALSAQDANPLPPGGLSFENLEKSLISVDNVVVYGPQPVQQPPETKPPERPVATKPPDQPLATRPPERPIITKPPAPPPAPAPGLPDLYIAAVEPGFFDPLSSTQELALVVGNAGDAAADSTRILVREQGGGGLQSSERLAELPPGEKREVWLKLQIPERLLGKAARFDIYVDPDNRIKENNKENNALQTRPIEFPAPQPSNGGDDPWSAAGWILGLVLVLVTFGLVVRSILRRLTRGRPQQLQEKTQGLPPVLPPVRLLNVWLTEGGNGQGKPISDDQPLVAGNEYCLHAQLITSETGNRRRVHAAGGLAGFPLEAVVYAPPKDFPIHDHRKTMQLPAADSGKPVFWPFRADESGLKRARVCLYYGNILLQSAFVEAQVLTKEDRRAKGRTASPGAIRRILDYVASATLTGLEQHPQPALSIFTNQAANGAGWIGVYAAGDPVMGFGSGLLRRVSPASLVARAGLVRRHLLAIEEAYTYSRQSRGSGLRAQQITRLEQDLAVLACEGWTLYSELFLLPGELSKQEKIRFDQALKAPGLVAISRCSNEKTTLPWAALYDYEVDTGKQDLLRLCPVFKSELEGHWSEDMAQYRRQRDWLENPQGCRLNPHCPLADDGIELLTICPFGFWGFRHQISQPLQLVQPTPVGQAPVEITRSGSASGANRFDKTIFLERQPNQRLKLALGVHPGLSQAQRLPVDIVALRPNEIEITYEEARDRVLELLKQGGFHFYILYCHGDRDESQQKFKLVFGPLADERSISSENLNPLKIAWPEQPKPLVLLNGCETVAVSPEMVHGLLDRLHELGASGVIGSEIQVYPSLAYPFGLALVERLLSGASLGEAFLDERKELLRKLTPLGLAYTYYAPAGLHIHLQQGCAWCAAHRIPAPGTAAAQSVKYA